MNVPTRYLLASFSLGLVTISHIQAAVPLRHVAYSLREASHMAKGGTLSAEVIRLAGITRIGGMVCDRERGDVILFGVASGDLPPAHLDDLVVALRSRLRYNEFPLVSIDPVAETEQTQLQQVRFAGHLEDSAYGRSFLDCDVLLKRHSLGTGCGAAAPVRPYTHWVEQDLRDRLARERVIVRSFDWMDAAQGKAVTTKLRGHPVRSAYDYQARFWFYVREPYEAWCKPDLATPEVFCIKSLEICLLSEGPTRGKAEAGNGAAEAYCRDWTGQFEEMCEAEPELKRLKLIFDLTAVADAIRHVERPAYLDYLLYQHEIGHVPTDRTLRLEERFCEVGRSDGRSHLLRLSGGIQFQSEIEFLHLGDITALQDIVIRSRPAENSVAWDIPLHTWIMPNAKPLRGAGPVNLAAGAAGSDERSAGCSMLCQSVVLDREEGTGGAGFAGFQMPREPLQPLKGVSMRFEVTDRAFRDDRSGSLNRLRAQLLPSPDQGGTMVWPRNKEPNR